VKVLKIPTPRTNLGSVWPGLEVKTYHNATSRKRGPARLFRQGSFCQSRLLLTRCDCDEELEDGALGVAVTDRGRDRGEPLDRVALYTCQNGLRGKLVGKTYEILILHNLLVVKGTGVVSIPSIQCRIPNTHIPVTRAPRKAV
jgi:hypothetical protein